MQYLLWTTREERNRKRTVGSIIQCQRSWISEDYALIQDDFEREYKGSQTGMVRLWDDQRTANSVWYDWGLAGPGGAWYQLIQLPECTKDVMQRARGEIRSKFDVVRMSTFIVHQLVEWDPTAHLVMDYGYMLRESENLYDSADSFAGYVNSLFEPGRGLLTRYQTRAQRIDFMRSEEYRQIQHLVHKAMNRFGV